MRGGSSIAWQLRGGLILLIVLLGAAAAAGLIGAVHQYQTINVLTTRTEPLRVANVELREHFTSSVAGLSGYLLTRSRSSLESYLESRIDFAAWQATLRALAPADLRDEVTAQARHASAWYLLAYQLLDGSHTSAAARRPDAGRLAAGAATARAFFAVNDALQTRLTAHGRRLIRDGLRSLITGLMGSGIALIAAVATAAVASIRTMRGITLPLHNLAATLGRLAAGDRAARAEVAGPAEVRRVAQSVNTLAAEGDRLRRDEKEHARLRAMARDAGNRIREHLVPEDVIRAAHAAIEQELDCDFVFVQLITEGRLGSPESYNRGAPLPPDLLTEFPGHVMEWLRDLYRRGVSLVVQDLPGPGGDVVPPVIREPLLRLGIVSHIVTPFGIGSDPLGIIIGERTRPGRPWTGAEIDAFQSIAADVGRGLNHARLYEAENRLVDDLKALDRAKSDFLATVSHELRTPLTSISGYVELLRDRDAGPLTPQQDLMLDTIHRNAALLRNLIENVLTISKIDLGVIKTVTQPVDLSEAVSAVVSAMQPVAESGGVTLASRCADRPLVVSGDVNQIDRVLLNLLSNAVKFTPRGGNVTVTVGRDDGSAVVRVNDTGIGIPDKDKKDLFTRFFRASNVVTRAVPGTGLGLSVSRTIVTDHGGELDVQSHEGAGTTVTVRLPLLDQQAPDAQPAHSERT